MRTLGRLIGESRSGNLIIKAEFVPSLSSVVVDKDLNRLGKVEEVFGPVDGPYISLERSGGLSSRPGSECYVLTQEDRRMGKWRRSTT